MYRFIPVLLLLSLGACASSAALAPSLGPLVTGDEVVFRFSPAYEARIIYIAGTFNGWRPDDPAYRMIQKEDGIWTLKVRLPSGRHQYKIVADEVFQRDTANPLKAPSGYDEPNSLVVVP